MTAIMYSIQQNYSVGIIATVSLNYCSSGINILSV